ncbi:hypothetical protein K493DRAFT_300657 [Basidiobolus meristosporus CBS 931.73]|uniref:DUF7729 domain-containing protein n=1 Tax=Basidiobolus meristosporus CBS 931.73 TaxID=1314790 RepID=A0A1Y1YFV2_9FUNG|nr:hypothetical protein K493DRAFT_300657 [Basidiobolus meristosporus CBS 931.73]|eukprot:ORX96921.1 hypothetical protein K493DRAFT_300657 [Basidiobolus meristosporus CBS 931.73]
MSTSNEYYLLIVSLILVLLGGAHGSLPGILNASGENELSQGCQSHVQQTLASDDFLSCKPFSFYMTLSKEFADMAKNASSIAPTMNEICAPGGDKQCEKLMKDMRGEFVKTQNCGGDMKKGSKIAMTMYISFVNYHLMQRTGCLKNQEDEYCFAEATSQRSQLDMYFMPYGHRLGSSSSGVPKMCTTCAQQIMNIYGRFGSQYLNPLRKTFDQSKMLMTQQCGSVYAKMLKNHMNAAPATALLPLMAWLILAPLSTFLSDTL